MATIRYKANSDRDAVINDAAEHARDKFSAYGRGGLRYYQIDRSGLYPLLQVCCRGKCNTYWRTIGRYPQVTY